MPFHKVIGIDLGTTYSAVSIWDGKEVHVIESAFGEPTVPSVVGLDPEGQVIVGAPAQSNLVSDPDNTIIEVKREMGVYVREPRPPDDPGEPRRIRFRGRDYLPQEISAFILMELKRQAEQYVGEPIHDAVITVPAYFKEPQRGATEDAARMARLNVKRLLNEPTAAAACFGADKVEDEETHTYAVYDLGGGTFDVSIVQVSPGNVTVIGTGGDPRLGGGDFDDLITGYVLDQIKQRHGKDLSGDHSIWQRIKREAEQRKRDLSVANAATLNLPYLTPTLSVNVPLTRATFEELIKDKLKRSLDCLDQAIESARESNGLERDEIEQVLLVGGSTRIACIRPMLAEHLGLPLKDIRSDVNPAEVVARGAGIVAREYQPSDGPDGMELATPEGVPAAADGAITLMDVTSHTLGILVNRSDMFPVLAKDSAIPAKATKGNLTNGGEWTETDVLVFQGESPVAFDNDLIGRLRITLPEARESGYYSFEVTFELNESGLLSVAVNNLKNKERFHTEVVCDVRASREQIDRSRQDLDEAFSGTSAAVDPEGDLPMPPPHAGYDDLPRPPSRPARPTEPELPPPPDGTPDEFRTVARRAYKKLGELSTVDGADLRAAYLAFVDAVRRGTDDVDDLGDLLDDAFLPFRRR